MFILKLENFLNNLCFLILFLSLIFYWCQLAFFSYKSINENIGFIIIFVNFLLFTILVLRWVISGHFPLSNLYESLIFLTWSLTFFHILLEKKLKTQLLGMVTLPLIFFISTFANLSLPEEMKKIGPLIPALQSNWLIMHVTVMILSYAALLIGCLLAISFLIMENQEKNLKKLNIFLVKQNTFSEILLFNSNLESDFTNFAIIGKTLDNLSYRILGIGFIFLTIGILSGAVWANQAWGSYWSWDPKETWAFITWLIFAIYFHSRIIKGWEGQKPAFLATLGFFIIWICYLGVNLLGKGLHSYGWIKLF